MTSGSPLLVFVLFVCWCLPTNCVNWTKGLQHYVPGEVAAAASADTATSIRAGGGSAAGAGHGYQQTGWIQDFCRKPGNEFFAEVGGAGLWTTGLCPAVVLQL